MRTTLFCWLGRTDIRASLGQEDGLGPIASAAKAYDFAEIRIISNYQPEESEPYTAWLRSMTPTPVVLAHKTLTSPTNFAEIYCAAKEELEQAAATGRTYHLSPGTPAMAAVWIILSKTTFPATLIESSREQGVKPVSLPFELAAEFIPTFLKQPDSTLKKLSATLPPVTPEFQDIIHCGESMQRVVLQARKVALRSVPVLIEGESGTGKELFARAIHSGGPRESQPFIAVNCGAIPSELVESELFGHIKGAFTGAAKDRKGHFEEAEGGTIFLDEIGELPKAAQVKLLRVLQEGEVVKVGSSHPVKVNVRIIAATNRDLLIEATEGRFRSDLFYRLAVTILKLPPLRQREGDLSLLIDSLMEQVNKDSVLEPGYKDKKISASAKNILLQHAWPGNVRELLNTIRRMAIWSEDEVLTEQDAQDAIIQHPVANQGILSRPIDNGIDLPEIMKEVGSHYLERAMTAANGNKTKAAKLLGLPSYQTLTNWLKKYNT